MLQVTPKRWHQSKMHAAGTPKRWHQSKMHAAGYTQTLTPVENACCRLHPNADTSRKCMLQVTPKRWHQSKMHAAGYIQSLTPVELHGVTATNTVNLHSQLRENIKPHTLPWTSLKIQEIDEGLPLIFNTDFCAARSGLQNFNFRLHEADQFYTTAEKKNENQRHKVKQQ